MADPAQDWRFKDFKDTGAPYNRTLAVPTSDFARTNFQNQYGNNNPSLPTAPVTAASRVIGSPSGTNWNSTFAQNNVSSPSGTDWAKTFGAGNSFSPKSATGNLQSAIQPPSAPSFSLNLSPATDRSGLSLDSPFTPRKSELAETITPRDHQLYGASPDLGFTY